MDTDIPDMAAIQQDGVPLRTERIPHALMPTFIGYARLEAWLQTRSMTHPIYLLPLIESGPDRGGIRIDTLVVVAQQQDEGGRIHYIRLRAAEMSRCFGEPFNSDWQEREAAWRSLAAAVSVELEARGLTILPATIAAPRDLRLLEGCSETICFDPTTKRYRNVTA